MQPGVIYTAPDGSTVTLQCFIHEEKPYYFNRGTPAEFMMRRPDRLTDVRLLERTPGGDRYATRLYCRTVFGDTTNEPPLVRCDYLETWQEPPNGIITEGDFW